MTNNFRKFNARIGIVFVFQNRLIRLFTWRTNTHTLSFLAVYTFVCLNPYLLVVLPLITALLFIMVPAFVARHPPPPPSQTTSSTTPYSEYTYSGPALAPASTIKPAAETSKDFFRNMRDLQNSMADFATIHDSMVQAIAPATNFSNEIRSSVIFLWLSVLATILFICAHILPWRVIFLFGGISLTVSGHPSAQAWLAKHQRRAENRANELLSSDQSKSSPSLSFIGIQPAYLASTLRTASSITLSTSPETREVEIFELQHRPIQFNTPQNNSKMIEWTPHVFTQQPYDPLSPSRISGDRPKGTPFFEDVRPPRGWDFKDKKWTMDLEPGEWVGERLIVGVGFDDVHAPLSATNDGAVDVGGNKGEGEHGVAGWVWDLPPASGRTRDEEMWLAYGDYEVPLSNKDTEKRKEKQKQKAHKTTPGSTNKDWEEIIRYDSAGKEKTGEWRRRRWVRVVKRVAMSEDGGKS